MSGVGRRGRRPFHAEIECSPPHLQGLPTQMCVRGVHVHAPNVLISNLSPDGVREHTPTVSSKCLLHAFAILDIVIEPSLSAALYDLYTSHVPQGTPDGAAMHGMPPEGSLHAPHTDACPDPLLVACLAAPIRWGRACPTRWGLTGWGRHGTLACMHACMTARPGKLQALAWPTIVPNPSSCVCPWCSGYHPVAAIR